MESWFSELNLLVKLFVLVFLFLFGNTFFVDGNTYILVTLFLILVTLKVGEEKNAHTRRLPNIVRYHSRLHYNNNIFGHLS